MTTIQISIPVALPDEAVNAEVAVGLISDAAAVAIAAMWQEPRPGGEALLALATGQPVSAAALRDDIAAARDLVEDPSSDFSSADRVQLDALARWEDLHGQAAALDRWLRVDTAAWLDVAGLTGSAGQLRKLPEITQHGGVHRAVEVCDSLTERVGAVEAVARQRALADLPDMVRDEGGAERAHRTSAELGASIARRGWDVSPVFDLPGSDRLVEVAGYLGRAASRTAAWRLLVGLPPVLAECGQEHVAEVLAYAHQVAAEALHS